MNAAVFHMLRRRTAAALPAYLAFYPADAAAGATIRLNKHKPEISGSSYMATPSLQYSYGYTGTWNTYTWSGANGKLLQIGDPYGRDNSFVMLRATPGATNPGMSALVDPWIGTPAGYRFAIVGDVLLDGNCMSLLNSDSPPLIAPDYCFYDLFGPDLNSLGTSGAPVDLLPGAERTLLPATTVGEMAYFCMFWCSGLTRMPELPAAMPDADCYSAMFRGTALTRARLHLATLSYTHTKYETCISSMFSGCTNLSCVEVSHKVHDTSQASSWLSDVAATGTLIVPNDADFASFTRDSPSGVPVGWTLKTAGGQTVLPDGTLVAPPVISVVQPTVGVSGTVGTAITSIDLNNNVTVSPAGTNLTFSASGLPNGLSLSSSGTLSGTPTAASSASVVVTVSAAGAEPQFFTLEFTIDSGALSDELRRHIALVHGDWPLAGAAPATEPAARHAALINQ